MTDSKEKKYVAICFKCKEYELIVESEDAVCPICGGEIKIIGEKTGIYTSNGPYKSHF
jgi:rRNA maturation endonuclease Nob1